jgi:catechol 2,3-dioxygenase-like lactoylglutathione lyase family enzyme
MLGQFLEIAVATRPLAAAFEFYRALGFRSIPVGDVLADSYAAFFDGAVAIGLHERDGVSPVLTFVRPRLRDYVRSIHRLGVEIEHKHLADDEFNWVGFSDPCGQAVALLEARTFPPGDWDPKNVSACGDFLEYSVAAESLETGKAFWIGLGLKEIAAGDEPHPWVRLAGHGIVLGLHRSAFRCGPTFKSAHVEARLEYLRAKGLTARSGSPLADTDRSITVVGPDGMPIYLLESVAS